jgi:hypothetical protein
MLPTLTYECTEFLTESGGKPLLKNLPSRIDGFVRIKVRQKKSSNLFTENFNNAFASERAKLLQRSMFAQGLTGFVPSTDPNMEPFYVFPVDGYRYMYNPHAASTDDYRETFSKLLSSVGSGAQDMFQKMLKYDYVFEDLQVGIDGGSQLIVYGISHYFALRKSIIEDYDSFMYK